MPLSIQPEKKPESKPLEKPKKQYGPEFRKWQYESEERKRSFNRRGSKTTKKQIEALKVEYPVSNITDSIPSLNITSRKSNLSPLQPPICILNNINVEKNVWLQDYGSDIYHELVKAEKEGLPEWLPYQSVDDSVFDAMSYAPHKHPHFPLSVYYKSSTRPEKTGTGLLFKKEKRTMQADNTSTNPVRESIRNLTMLNLSKWGQIKLMAYPDQAIAHAYKELQHANPRDPFKWFVSLCLKYCKENQLAPDWTGMLTLSRTQNMPDDAPMTLGPLLKHLRTATPSPESKAGKATPSKKAQSLLHITHLKAISLFTEDVPRYKRTQFYVMRQLENSAQDYPQSRPAWETWYNSDEATEFKAWLAEYPLEYVATWDPFTFDYENHRRNLLEKDKSDGTVFANPYAIMSDNTQNNYDKKASLSYTSSSPVHSESMIHDLDEWRPNEVDSYLASDYESATIWE